MNNFVYVTSFLSQRRSVSEVPSQNMFKICRTMLKMTVSMTLQSWIFKLDVVGFLCKVPPVWLHFTLKSSKTVFYLAHISPNHRRIITVGMLTGTHYLCQWFSHSGELKEGSGYWQIYLRVFCSRLVTLLGFTALLDAFW